MTERGYGAGLLGESDAMQRLRALIRKVAPTTLPVLIQGPTGAGKELVAHALHELSGRRGVLVACNICALPDALFEDALFGHVRGAFSGATDHSAGLMLEADGGTLFLNRRPVDRHASEAPASHRAQAVPPYRWADRALE